MTPGATGWTQIAGQGTRIAVGGTGNVWHLNAAGNIYKWTGSGWQQKPGQARDIGIGSDGTAWIIGWDTQPGGYSIHRMAPAESNWVKQPGGAVTVSVGSNDTAWVVNNAGNIFKWSK